MSGTAQIFPVVGSGISIPNPLPINVTEWDSTVLTGVPTNFGTAPSGTVIGGNVSIFAGGSALVVDGSNNLYVHKVKVPQVPAAPAAAAVGLLSSTVVNANPNRTGLRLVNTSAFTISLAFGMNSAVVNSGVVLGAGAGFTMDDFSFTLQSVTAIGNSTICNLAIQEFS